MRDFYFNSLKKEEKKKIIQEYKKEYAKSEFQKRLFRLMIYSLVSYAFSIFLVVYSLIVHGNLTLLKTKIFSNHGRMVIFLSNFTF